MTKEPFNIDTLDAFTRAYMECALWSSTDTRYKNAYEHCGESWEDTASSMCNDKCPVCGKEITPVSSEELQGNLDDEHDITDIAPGTRDKMIADCAKFQADNSALIESDNPRLASDGQSTPLSHAGHDFWLTRCGHGAGFWDGDWPVNGDALTEACKAYPNIDLYIGEDGLIYGQ